MAQRGRSVLALLATLAVVGAGVAGAWWYLTRARPIDGAIIGLYAVGPDRAVICTRSSADDEQSRAWLALIDWRHGPLWHAELPAMPVDAPREGMTVSGGVVTVRVARDPETLDGLATAAYSLQSGAKLWEFDLASGLRAPTHGSGAFANPELHLETLETEDGLAMIALERQTGTLVWRRLDAEHGGNLQGARIVGQHLLSEPLAEALFYSLANDAPPLEVQSSGPGCMLGGRYYALGTPEDASGKEPDAIVLLSVRPAKDGLIDPKLLPLVLPWLAGASHYVKVEACGIYDGKLIFTYGRAREGTADGLEIIALDPDSAEIIWYLDMGAVNLRASKRQKVIYDEYRESFPLSGKLPRFAPVLLDETREGDHTRFVILDLERHRIVREGPKRDDLMHAAVFKVDATSYLVGRLTGPFLVTAIDGATGELHAVHLYGPYGEVWPFHVRDGTLWIYNSERKPIDAAPWAALDATTLAPRFNNGVVIGDADAEALSILGAGAHPQAPHR